MNRFRIIYKFVLHFFSARNTKGYSVHSPFVFQFTRSVLCEKHSFYTFQTIEHLRDTLKKDKRVLNIKDFGTGEDRNETISDIAKKSLKSAVYGQLLFRIVRYFKARNILELGTSLGVTTCYLAASSSEISCVSLEGCPLIAEVAKENIKNAGFKNIEIVVGNIDTTLAEVLNDMPKLDVVFIDANHRYEAILSYFELCMTKVQNSTVIG